MGSAIRVSIADRAPTMPVVAAMMVPSRVTAMARPPGTRLEQHLQGIEQLLGDLGGIANARQPMTSSQAFLRGESVPVTMSMRT